MDQISGIHQRLCNSLSFHVSSRNLSLIAAIISLILAFVVTCHVARSSSLASLLSHKDYSRVNLSDERLYEDEDGISTEESEVA